MSYQAYLDAIEEKTGRTPAELLEQARQQGFDGTTKASTFTAWMAEAHGVGRGHAMALYGVLKNGTRISDKHVGTDGTHRDESTALRLDGLGARRPD